MSRTFNAVMRVISSLIGVLMVLMGGIWIVQGPNLAWGSLSRSFMQGHQPWVFYVVVKSISLSESRMHFNLAQVWTREQHYRL